MLKRIIHKFNPLYTHWNALVASKAIAGFTPSQLTTAKEMAKHVPGNIAQIPMCHYVMLFRMLRALASPNDSVVRFGFPDYTYTGPSLLSNQPNDHIACIAHFLTDLQKCRLAVVSRQLHSQMRTILNTSELHSSKYGMYVEIMRNIFPPGISLQAVKENLVHFLNSTYTAHTLALFPCSTIVVTAATLTEIVTTDHFYVPELLSRNIIFPVLRKYTGLTMNFCNMICSKLESLTFHDHNLHLRSQDYAVFTTVIPRITHLRLRKFGTNQRVNDKILNLLASISTLRECWLTNIDEEVLFLPEFPDNCRLHLTLSHVILPSPQVAVLSIRNVNQTFSLLGYTNLQELHIDKVDVINLPPSLVRLSCYSMHFSLPVNVVDVDCAIYYDTGAITKIEKLSAKAIVQHIGVSDSSSDFVFPESLNSFASRGNMTFDAFRRTLRLKYVSISMDDISGVTDAMIFHSDIEKITIRSNDVLYHWMRL